MIKNVWQCKNKSYLIKKEKMGWDNYFFCTVEILETFCGIHVSLSSYFSCWKLELYQREKFDKHHIGVFVLFIIYLFNLFREIYLEKI